MASTLLEAHRWPQGSARRDPGLHARLLDQGARAMLSKPLDVKEFLGLLDAIANEYEQAAPSTRASSQLNTQGGAPARWCHVD